MGAGEVFFDLFEFAVLGDDFAELGLLLGDFLEACGVRDDLRGGKFLRELVIASTKLIQFLSKRKNGHCSTSKVFSDQFSVRKKNQVKKYFQFADQCGLPERERKSESTNRR